MNIREALLAEHSKRQTMAIVDYVGERPERFAELMTVFFKGPYRVTQRAAWPMNYCAERHPELIYPYLNRLLKELERDDVHDAVKRNVVRLLQFVVIPKRLHAKVFSICIDLIDSVSEPTAVRVFAITVAAKIAEWHPPLMNELKLVVSKHVSRSSIAFCKRAREVL